VLVAILIVETYFTIWAPSLESRAQALSAGLLVVSFECMWLTLLGVERKMRSMTRGVGVAFALMGLICLARIIELGVQPPQTDDLLKTTAVDAWILLGLEGSFAVLTFALVMMVNGRLLAEARDNEAQIRRRTLELEAANKGLEAYNYSVSHDLLGDVKSLDMFSQSLLNEQGGSLSARGKELVHYIQACGQSMSGLIGDMLNLSRVGRAGMAVETVDMSELARTIAEELRRGQPERNVEFIIPPGMVAEGDPALLKIALQNLLSNAWKYTAKVERAVVEFGSTQDYGERVYFVRDNGVGFDAADSGRLFRPFQRLHPVAQYPGNGVGLAIVQRAIDRHGGRVWAFGVPGKGATFYFTLPAPK